MPTKEKILGALKKVLDPELGVNIVDMGLIYNVDIKKEKVKILMTMTFPGCPLVPYFEENVPKAAKKVKGVKEVDLQFTFDPPWKPEMMKEELREELGFHS